jgi:hypothetical protein
MNANPLGASTLSGDAIKALPTAQELSQKKSEKLA